MSAHRRMRDAHAFPVKGECAQRDASERYGVGLVISGTAPHSGQR